MYPVYHDYSYNGSCSI